MAIEHRTVAQDEAETRLDRWFRRHFPRLTQGAIQKMLRTGQVRVNGKRADAGTRLEPGQEVRIPPLPEAPPPDEGERRKASPEDENAARDLASRIIHRDDAVLVLDKPHGLPVQGGPGITRSVDSMLDAFRFGAEERPRLVHRLDRDTSGVLVLARSAAVASRLASAFRGRDVEKTYWALVVGRPEAPEGRIDLSLAKLGGPRGHERVRAVDDPEEGTRAITDFRVLDTVKNRVAWLELRPLTGRTHQLRVHCAEGLGCPILGDGKYGGAGAHMERVSGKLHLHARALRLPHPNGGVLEVAAPPPSHMRDSFAFFGFEAPRTPKARHLSPGPRR
ncbi:MAG: RluA family pseudouridine synthase [Acetobacteraceae bacterium]|nr:RluA family pseudouridine synthase [Acetobacteraceae bacterium]